MSKFYAYCLGSLDEDNVVLGPYASYDEAEHHALKWWNSLTDDEFADSSYDILEG